MSDEHSTYPIGYCSYSSLNTLMIYRRYPSSFVNSNDYFTTTLSNGLTEYKSYHINGKIEEIFYMDDEKHVQGTFTRYYSNGFPFLIIDVVDNCSHGSYKEYDLQGQLLIEGTIKNEMYHGLFKHYGKNKSYYYCNNSLVDLEQYGMDVNNLSDDQLNMLTVLFA